MRAKARHLAAVLAVALSGGLHAQTSAPEAPDATAPAQANDTKPGRAPMELPAAAMPHLHIDREAGIVDVDARVVLREGEWLELIACAPNSKEHESLVVVLARPSHIHLALLTLGLEPGTPMTVEKLEDGYKVHPAQGPQVEVSFVVGEGAQRREVPANEWVVAQQTGEVMGDNLFLFAGSTFVNYEGEDIYMADLSGAVVSLVNFGDDLLTRDTTATNNSDNQVWNANTAQIPPLDTPVTLRLRPMKAAE